MNIEIWHIWIIISILLFIIEIFAPTFLAISLAIGCLTSGIVAYFGFDLKIQLIAFSFGTLISFFGVRPIMLKYFHKNSDEVKTNTDALVGRTGRVIDTIDYSKNQGRIMIDGDNWRAETENNEIINEGEQIEVIKVNSTILIVKLITKI
jgi:membrane protein implicated in regulation of membrane protease activity